MLLIIELLFLATGLWAIYSGKIPVVLFNFLFGKGTYELSPNKTRLFGLFLASPLPASFFVSYILTSIVGAKATGIAIIFEIIYILVIITTSIIVAKKARHSGSIIVDNSPAASPPLARKTSNYGLRLLIIFGIVILGCITAVSAFSLLMVVISSITVGTRWTGDFWSDIFPFILTFAVIGIGSFGIIKLVQILRR
jgi:hypothetical protein